MTSLGDGPRLASILEAHGIAVAQRDVCGVNGLSVKENGRWRVSVAGDNQGGRGLFTLGHELGHIYLNGERHALSAEDEERWCNNFASELLLPAEMIEERFGKARVGMEPVLNLSRAAGVTVPAAFVRLNSLRHWNHMLVKTQARASMWRVASVYGGPVSAALAVQLDASATQSLLDDRIRKPRRMRVPFVIAGTRAAHDCVVYGTTENRWILLAERDFFATRRKSRDALEARRTAGYVPGSP